MSNPITDPGETVIRRWRHEMLQGEAIPTETLRNRVLTLCDTVLADRQREPDRLAAIVAGRPVLTRAELKVLRAIVDFKALHIVSPTLEEIGEAVDIKSRSTVWKQVGALIQKGYVTIDPGKRRSIRINEARA